MPVTSEQFLRLLGTGREVLWPDFMEHDGCVFVNKLDDTDKQTYRDWLDQLGGDRPRVEAVMNHQHIVELLEHVVESPSREVVLTVGRLMRDLWASKLSRDFPERRFIVSFPEDHCDDLVEYEITFFQTP